MLERFDELTTAHVADACLRSGLPVRTVSLTAVVGGRVAGRVLPVQHMGSIDVYLEAFENAIPGDVLVVDNGGRRDEACVGDLISAEAQGAGCSGVVIWGLHRDTVDVQAIGLPLFSLGALPNGPIHLDPQPADALSKATIGEWTVTSDDLVLGDEDGLLFVPADRIEELFDLADSIMATERRQSEDIRAGRSLREQVNFGAYLTARAADPSLTFRQHLDAAKGAIEQ
ncbi:RraA family protein [Kribbella sp. NBC_01505]|uniref:RraA family protein n=1 Tax=Kribbella sp. NBC_01505 TaxID=2903580 RepID=UPI003864E3AE